MLGLRPDTDQVYYNNLSKHQPQFNKSSKFATRLNGRFFVAGVSGSFQKHRQQLLEQQAIQNNQPLPSKKDLIPKYTYQPVLEKHQREELRKEAERLLELEEKLNELQRVKEAKRHRDRERRRKKQEFQSSVVIQKAFRRFLQRKRTHAVVVIVDFIK